ncbi:MAG: CAP domain-containing protein [Clostridiales bacterium]|nr:CAP domain-containing protein [Clostridiales bacterium]
MNCKQKLTAILLTMLLAVSQSALASAPTSQFGFKGWPYRNNSCQTAAETPATPCPTRESCPATPQPTQEAPLPTPTVIPDTPEPAPSATATATPEPTLMPEPTAKPAPTAAPTVSQPAATATPAAPPVSVTPAIKPTASPKPTKAPETTKKPVETVLPPSTDGDYTTGSITAQEENAFLLLNQDRISNGRSALTLDPALCEIARKKSQDMYANHYFAHNSPTYGSAAQMLKTFGYSFTSVGENIAHHANVAKAQAAFMSSAGHRQSILGSQWTKVGIGVCYDSQGYVYVTQLFVR